MKPWYVACTAASLLVLQLLAPATALADPPPNGKPQPLRVHHHAAADPPGLLPKAALHPAAAAGLAKLYSGTPIDVLTYHYDTLRTGWNPQETDLTAASVASNSFGLLTTLIVDGNVFAQPLLVSNFIMPDGSTHSVLIVATGHNSVYAFDAQSYTLLWHVNLGPSQASNDIGCDDVIPEYGISSTPVIVRSAANAATIYVVSATEPGHLDFRTSLHALDLATGADLRSPVTIAPSAELSNDATIAFDPQNQWNRPGLAFANNSIYVAVGSHCDNNQYSTSGWLLRYSPALGLRQAFHTIGDAGGQELASIWMSGFAPAIDPAGGVYVVTGNGDFNLAPGHHDYGESVLALTPSLGTVRSTFTPANYESFTDNDTDFGSGGVMLLPGIGGVATPPLAVAIGKDATLYLLNRHSLGGESAGDAGALWWSRLGARGSGVWGGPAFFNGPAGPLVYVQISHGPLQAFLVNTGAAPTLTATLAGTSPAGYGGSLPIVSSSGGKPGSGLVWLIRRGSIVQLEAYNATTLGTPIFATGAGLWPNPEVNPFLTPMEANGRVYVPAYGTVAVFGLTQ